MGTAFEDISRSNFTVVQNVPNTANQWAYKSFYFPNSGMIEFDLISVEGKII